MFTCLGKQTGKTETSRGRIPRRPIPITRDKITCY